MFVEGPGYLNRDEKSVPDQAGSRLHLFQKTNEEGNLVPQALKKRGIIDLTFVFRRPEVEFWGISYLGECTS